VRKRNTPQHRRVLSIPDYDGGRTTARQIERGRLVLGASDKARIACSLPQPMGALGTIERRFECVTLLGAVGSPPPGGKRDLRSCPDVGRSLAPRPSAKVTHLQSANSSFGRSVSTSHFSVAVFARFEDTVLVIHHKRLGGWLSPRR
jgi:hypothetical protein